VAGLHSASAGCWVCRLPAAGRQGGAARKRPDPSVSNLVDTATVASTPCLPNAWHGHCLLKCCHGEGLTGGTPQPSVGLPARLMGSSVGGRGVTHNWRSKSRQGLGTQGPGGYPAGLGIRTNTAYRRPRPTPPEQPRRRAATRSQLASEVSRFGHARRIVPCAGAELQFSPRRLLGIELDKLRSASARGHSGGMALVGRWTNGG